jgi:branched-chain amino acid transport system ATP-binding protein
MRRQRLDVALSPAESATTVLKVSNLTLSFGSFRVIDDFSMDIASNETVALVGPNGAGKTSLLNCINRVYACDSGSVTLDGHSLDKLRPEQVAGRGIARTFQSSTIFNDMRVIDIVMLGRHKRLSVSFVGYAVGWAAGKGAEARDVAICRDVLALLGVERLGLPRVQLTRGV